MKRKNIVPEMGGAVVAFIKQGSAIIKNRDTAKLKAIARPAVIFTVAFLLGLVRAPMGVYPFGIAAIAAARGGTAVIATTLGATLSAFTHEAEVAAHIIIQLSIAALRFFVCFMKGDLKEKRGLMRRLFCEAGYIRMILAAMGAAAAGCVSLIHTESIYYGLFSALFGIGMTLLFAASFMYLFDKSASAQKRSAGLCLLAGGLCASLNAFGIPFDLGAVGAFIIPVYFSYCKNAVLGAASGIACGLAVGAPYTAAFALSPLVSSLLWDHSRPLAVVCAGLVSSTLALFCTGTDALSDVIPELTLATALASSLFSTQIVPRALPHFLNMDGGIVIGQDTARINARYLKLSESMTALSKMLLEVGDKLCLPTKGEAMRICTTARARHCSGCPNEGECSGRDDATVTSMFNNMAYRLSTAGSITAKIVPETIARRCFNMDNIIDSVNSGAKRLTGLSEQGKKTEMLAHDYSAVAELLRDVAETDGCERDKEAEEALEYSLSKEGFSFSQASVYGKRARRVYMRGVDTAACEAGERDIRLCAEKVLGGKLSSPEFSIESGGVCASMRSVPAFELRAGRYSISSKKDAQSGDSLCSFQNDEGYFYTLVSDGMGSGREAAITSSLSASFLEKLLYAGCPMKSALELLNCFVRGSDGECFTTVDLMEADLYTGKARFIKSGAAPSFVIRNGQLYRLHSKTVPVGIMRALDAEALSFDLLSGDTVIMMSDGVTGSYEECPWLYELLVSGLCKMTNPGVLAKYIAEEAQKNTGGGDDITVCVLKVEAA
ncbi:MAG: SpoIIE family protein phosphatase [Clostridia bacterium]|nr:SpoIIE family protein phosphatase [Clostridia bacterium]